MALNSARLDSLVKYIGVPAAAGILEKIPATLDERLAALGAAVGSADAIAAAAHKLAGLADTYGMTTLAEAMRRLEQEPGAAFSPAAVEGLIDDVKKEIGEYLITLQR
jgi:HPt (histidine-containing phosphotransfer) domain-containing protein